MGVPACFVCDRPVFDYEDFCHMLERDLDWHDPYACCSPRCEQIRPIVQAHLRAEQE